MSTQTPATGLLDYLKIPTGQQVYDSLMAKIEPELVSGNIPHLDEPYTGETPEQRTVRYKKYERAYAAYDTAYQTWLKELSEVVQEFRRKALKEAESMSRQEEADAINALESQFDTSVSPVSA